MGLGRLLSAAKAAAMFAVRRPKDAAIIVLLAALALAGWRLRREQGRSRELTAKLEGLPPGTKQSIVVHRDHVVVKWRDGPVRVEYRDRYLPPEGHVEVAVKDDKPDAPPEVHIKDRGLTARLGGGFVYAGKFTPLIDVKLGYWRRYSLSLGITPLFGGAGVSRHIDDFTPFPNLEILGMAGMDWSGDPRLGVGLRVNF